MSSRLIVKENARTWKIDCVIEGYEGRGGGLSRLMSEKESASRCEKRGGDQNKLWFERKASPLKVRALGSSKSACEVCYMYMYALICELIDIDCVICIHIVI